jgi:hypothetical protein
MKKELRWHIGKESGRLDRPPYRAYFYWLEDERPIDSSDFDAAELDAEIARRVISGDQVEQFQAARKELAIANS